MSDGSLFCIHGPHWTEACELCGRREHYVMAMRREHAAAVRAQMAKRAELHLDVTERAEVAAQ